MQTIPIEVQIKMEITIFCLVWITTLFLTYLSYVDKNNWSLPILAGIGYLAIAFSLGEITYIIGTGTGTQYIDVNIGNAHTVGLLGIFWWLRGIATVLILTGLATVLSGKKTGDKV